MYSRHNGTDIVNWLTPDPIRDRHVLRAENPLLRTMVNMRVGGVMNFNSFKV